MGIEEKLPAGILLTSVEKLSNYARKSSFWGATFGLACCAIEMMASGGRVSQKMAPVVRQIYDQMPEPRSVISMGVCASSGGMFNNYAIVQGVDHIIPVDIYLPGCPPRPEMLIDAILKMREKVMAQPLGPNGRKMLEARQAEGRVPVVAPGAMPSSYRVDKVRREEWTQAVKEGREEQLRIENWMKLQPHLREADK
jgi:NADH-quinone oxidoreductase subunit B